MILPVNFFLYLSVHKLNPLLYCRHLSTVVVGRMEHLKKLAGVMFGAIVALALLANLGCSNTQAKQAPAAQALPVQTQTVTLAPVARSDEYVATVKSRRSATIQPQVDGSLTRILAKSGDHVRAGQVLMTIDPLKQEATVNQQHSTEAQKKASLRLYKERAERQRRLYEAGVTSKQSYDLAVQAYENAKADWEASIAASETQKRQLAYYNLSAVCRCCRRYPRAHWRLRVAADCAHHGGRERRIRSIYLHPHGTCWRYTDGTSGADRHQRGKTHREHEDLFISQQVDNALQGILVKAPIHTSLDKFRNAQLVKARVVWSTAPAPKVPVLAVARIGGQSFVYVATQGIMARCKQRAVNLGDTVGNDYVVTSGLHPGDKVIVSGIQFLIDGAPVQPIS